jgi:hypothetical protein
MINLAYDVQGVLVCHPVPQAHTVKAQCYKPFLQCRLRCAGGRSVRNWLKMLLSCVIVLQPAQQTPLTTFSGVGSGRSCDTVAILPTSDHVTMIWFPNWSSHFVGALCKQRGHLTAVGHEMTRFGTARAAIGVQNQNQTKPLTLQPWRKQAANKTVP